MPDFAAALAPIAEALGDGWSAVDSGDNYRGILAGPDGMRIWVRTENSAAARGRLFFSGSYEGLYDHVWQLDRTEISVTVSKTPAQVAADIKRRLIPKYREGIAEARRRKATHDAEEAERDALGAEITAALGPGAENSGTGHHGHRNHVHVHFGRYGAPVDARFEVPTGDYGVKVEITVSKDLAVKLAAAIAALT
jgi:hypothetical protein